MNLSNRIDSRASFFKMKICEIICHQMKTIFVICEERHFSKRDTDGLICVVIRAESSAGVQEDLLLLMNRDVVYL